MLVSDELLDVAKTDDHLAFELINGWSYSYGKQLGGNAVPGMWMTGAAMRLMERTRAGVLHVDLVACRAYANGLADAAAVRCPVLAIMGARDLMTPMKGAQALLEDARRQAHGDAARHRPCHDGRATRCGAGRTARVSVVARHDRRRRSRLRRADVRTVAVGAPLRWLAAGWSDFRAHPVPSAFYGACFALMGFLVHFVFGHAYQYVSALVTGFFLVGPFLAIGLYDLSRRRQSGQPVWLAPTLDAWRPNVGSVGIFALVLVVILLVWARASLVVFALFFTYDMPDLHGFLAQVLSLAHVEFLLAYLCVGGFFAVLVFAISVVSVPMMLDRNTDGVVAALTSLRVFGANVPAMIVWGLLIVVLTGIGFATWFVGLAIVVPVIGHATWHAYRELVA